MNYPKPRTAYLPLPKKPLTVNPSKEDKEIIDKMVYKLSSEIENQILDKIKKDMGI